MNNSKYTQQITQLADRVGVQINGSDFWDIRVNDERFYQMVARDGSVGLGESYMDGYWDCQCLDALFTKISPADLAAYFSQTCFSRLLAKVVRPVINLQNVTHAVRVGKKHFELDHKLYRVMLDTELNYSCGYWPQATNLKQAQNAKLELICQKIGLKPGDRILDIGCGYGRFASYAIRQYGAEVVAITTSKQQFDLAQQLTQGLTLDLRLADYRMLSATKDGYFEHIVSIEMFERLARSEYAALFIKVAELLKDDGLFLLQTIGDDRATVIDPWIKKYILPNGFLPSAKLITQAAEQILGLEDWQNFGVDYAKTLMAWHHNFKHNWHMIQDDFEVIFYRMWSYYLLSYAGAFRSRSLQLWQIVWAKHGVANDYQSIR